jgi:hypothetical protein
MAPEKNLGVVLLSCRSLWQKTNAPSGAWVNSPDLLDRIINKSLHAAWQYGTQCAMWFDTKVMHQPDVRASQER